MVFMNMWMRGDLKCVLVVADLPDGRYRVRLVDQGRIVRDEPAHSGTEAFALSSRWQNDRASAATRG